ncbi:MAG: GGDEF domain-containing protein [Pseudomonadota bacterium]
MLTFVIPAIAMIFAAVFAGLWWQDRARLHVAAYCYSYAALGIGVAINIWIFGNVGPAGIVAYHLLSMSGLIALLWGTSRRVGLKTPMWAYVGSVLLTSGFLWAAAALNEPDAMRLAQNVNSSMLMALAAQNLWHAGSRRLADRAVIWVLGTFSLFGFIRPLLTVFSDQLFGPGPEGAALLFAVHVLVLAVFLTLQAISLIATILVDKSEQEREVAALDPLSGLPMRAMFEAEALAMQLRAREHGESLSLVIADLDQFKRINDTLGHAAGDRVIAAFGQLIASEIRPHDICGRIGGEEFCIVASKCEGKHAESLANRIRMATKRMSVPGVGPELAISASFGVAEWDLHEPYGVVFDRADAALYKAKRSGRDCALLAQRNLSGGGPQSDADAPTPISQPASADDGADVVPLAQRAANSSG